VPNNRLLVSLAQRFGVELERFGQSKNAALLLGKLDALS
jgi:hypothetical protein